MATSTSSVESNRELVRRELFEVIEEHNVDVVDELYADDVVVRTKRTGSDEPVVGKADIKALYTEWLQAFPDLSVDVNEEVAEGDVVVQYVTLHGTHEGRFRDVEPTGRDIEIDGFQLREVRDGKIVASTSMVGMGALMKQLGLEVPIRG